MKSTTFYKPSMKNLLTGIVVLPALLALGGCGVWRAETPIATPEMPTQFKNAKLIAEYNAEPWWLSFNDPNLNDLMDQAFDANLTLQQAAGRLGQLSAAFRGSKSSWLPSITASGNYRASDLQGSDAPTSGSYSGAAQPSSSNITFEGYTISLNASYEIDLWGKLSARRRASYADLLAGEEDYKAVVLSMSTQLAGAYYKAVELKLQLDLLNATVSGYEDYVEIVTGRYERGVSPSVELYQARINLARALSQKTQLEAGLASVNHAISILLGKYPAELGLQVTSLPESLPNVSPGLPSELLQRRPDVMAAYHRLRSSDARWAEAVQSLYPSFSLSGQLGGSSDDLAEALDPDKMLWTAIGNLTAPIFMGGALKANSDRAESAFKMQLAAYNATLLNAFREVEDALVQFEKQKQYVGEVEALTTSAENLLRVATDRYMRGLSDYLPLVLAQTETLNARRNFIAARRGMVDAYIRLSAALGGEWMSEKLEIVENN